MKTYQFKVELLSDIILNQKAASKGNQETLDFIPGSNFLGIVASSYKEFENSEQIAAFHSSKFRFGDAHPLFNNIRAVRTPASFHFPKLDVDKKAAYIHHKIVENSVFHRELQLKQSRDGFCVFEGDKVFKLKIDTNFAIKSSYDRGKRRSKDEEMYGYQSMQAGSIFCFELNVDDDVSEELIEKVISKLKGRNRVGRSRTAQYGLVNIEQEGFEQFKLKKTSDSEVVIYAESRLIFLDEFNNPTLQPKVSDFGLSEGTIDWQKSQIRSFAYSPYNYTRRSFDSERKGIEKGSVFVIKGAKTEEIKEFVGSYQNEGFGKVIVNPSFFKADEKAKSELQFEVIKDSGEQKNNNPNITNESDKAIFDYLEQQKDIAKKEKEVFKLVNDFVKNNTGDKSNFSGHRFASQWGTIRTLAMQHSDYKTLHDALFKEKTGYLTHGVAAEKWKEKSRIDKLKIFFDNVDKDMIQYAMINLASEMAKKCRRK